MSSDECNCGSVATAALNAGRRRALVWALAINAAMFVGEFGFGLLARSSALQADSVDMLIDALAYAVSLIALNRSSRWRAAAGFSNAALELVLAVGIVLGTLYRSGQGITPDAALMLPVAAVALCANLGVAALLLQHRDADINMRAVWLCTRNDVLGNAATLLAGGLVLLLGSPWPDWIVGLLLAALIARTSVTVLRDAWAGLRS